MTTVGFSYQDNHEADDCTFFLIMEQWQPNQTESFSATIAPYPEVWYLELANPKLHRGFQQFFK